MISQTAHDAAVIAARAEGAAAERGRMTEILNSREASGKERAAIGLALSNVSPATAKTILAGSSEFERGKAIAQALK